MEELQELLAARRVLENLAAAAADVPGVDPDAIRQSPSLGAMLDHIFEAGRAAARREHEAEMTRLEAEQRALEVELGKTSADDPANGPPRGAPPEPARPPARATRRGRQAAPVALSLPPWLEEVARAKAVVAAFDALAFDALDVVREPDPQLPQFIREDIVSATDACLADGAARVVRGEYQHPEGREAYLGRFTQKRLRRPREEWPAAAVALWEGRWCGKQAPMAYLHTVTEREHHRATGWLDPERSRDVFALGNLRSLQMPTATGDPLEALIVDEHDRLADCVAEIDWELVAAREAVPADVLAFVEACRAGYPRRAMPAYLGWSLNRVEAAYKQLTRMRPGLREAFPA